MNYLSFIENKIVREKETLIHTLSQWRFKEEKIVFTNGCFDILHRGHIEYLAQAAGLGQKLVIGLNTDASVKRLKGDKRPVDILVKGSDYKPEEIVGYDIVKAKGGEIITIDLTPGFSTTSILQKL